MRKDEEPILTKDEIYSKTHKKVTYTNDDYLLVKENLDKHSTKYDFFKSHIKPGQHFLYEIVEGMGKHSISYPKLGIFLDSYPCDQTIEIEWALHRRTWEYNFKFNEHCYVGEQRSELQYLILWSDEMLIYGIWDAKPNWKQLKQAYEKTWWFWRDSQELRDIQINRILNG